MLLVERVPDQSASCRRRAARRAPARRARSSSRRSAHGALRSVWRRRAGSSAGRASTATRIPAASGSTSRHGTPRRAGVGTRRDEPGRRRDFLAAAVALGEMPLDVDARVVGQRAVDVRRRVVDRRDATSRSRIVSRVARRRMRWPMPLLDGRRVRGLRLAIMVRRSRRRVGAGCRAAAASSAFSRRYTWKGEGKASRRAISCAARSSTKRSLSTQQIARRQVGERALQCVVQLVVPERRVGLLALGRRRLVQLELLGDEILQPAARSALLAARPRRWDVRSAGDRGRGRRVARRRRARSRRGSAARARTREGGDGRRRAGARGSARRRPSASSCARPDGAADVQHDAAVLRDERVPRGVRVGRGPRSEEAREGGRELDHRKTIVGHGEWGVRGSRDARLSPRCRARTRRQPHDDAKMPPHDSSSTPRRSRCEDAPFHADATKPRSVDRGSIEGASELLRARVERSS